MRIHTCIHTCVHTVIHTCTHIYILACIRTYIHTRTHTYKHTYIHTYMNSFNHTLTFNRRDDCVVSGDMMCYAWNEKSGMQVSFPIQKFLLYGYDLYTCDTLAVHMKETEMFLSNLQQNTSILNSNLSTQSVGSSKILIMSYCTSPAPLYTYVFL